MVRLHKYLAQAGVGSRRACEIYIQNGRVQVDEEIINEVGFQLENPANHVITFDGNPIEKEKRVYYLLNKPKGVLCTNDPKDPRPKVTQLIRDTRRLFPVGRLDVETEGLIVLTNDGDLANKLAHPRYKTTKTYIVKVRGKLTPRDIETLREGVWFDFGKAAFPKMRINRSSVQFSSITLTLSEGKNRMIRRIFAKIQHPVVSIERVRIGPLSIKGIPKGHYRILTHLEIKSLWEEKENKKTDKREQKRKFSKKSPKKAATYPLGFYQNEKPPTSKKRKS